MKYPTRIVHALFPSVVCFTSARGVHLTFDDGPHPDGTPTILRILGERNIKATFFLIGECVERYPELTRRIVAEGHAVGNHSYSHARLLFRSTHLVRDELEKAARAFVQVAGATTQLFRPPFGWFDPRTLRVAREQGYKTVLWSHDSRDFTASPAKKIVTDAAASVKNGAILLFHDNERTSARQADLLPAVLDRLLALGSNFLPLST
jgi:peptidoglycan/xylan/chitin deacetylase (PgdA/CDA1 family)